MCGDFVGLTVGALAVNLHSLHEASVVHHAGSLAWLCAAFNGVSCSTNCEIASWTNWHKLWLIEVWNYAGKHVQSPVDIICPDDSSLWQVQSVLLLNDLCCTITILNRYTCMAISEQYLGRLVRLLKQNLIPLMTAVYCVSHFLMSADEPVYFEGDAPIPPENCPPKSRASFVD